MLYVLTPLILSLTVIGAFGEADWSWRGASIEHGHVTLDVSKCLRDEKNIFGNIVDSSEFKVPLHI